MKRIPLRNKYGVIHAYAIVDDEIFPKLNKWKWCLNDRYVKRYLKRKNGKRPTVLMHREVMGTPVGLETDHINGNTLDNRVSNLRIVTKSQNQWNRCVPKGFYFCHTHRKFKAQIAVNGKRLSLGYWATEEQARKAYHAAVMRFHGNFSKLSQGVGAGASGTISSAA